MPLDWCDDIRARFPDWGKEAAALRWREVRGKLAVGQAVAGVVVARLRSACGSTSVSGIRRCCACPRSKAPASDASHLRIIPPSVRLCEPGSSGSTIASARSA